MNKLDGIIIKGIGGFYYVESSNQIYECKARGIFRKNEIIPNVGDNVEIIVPSEGYASIEKIKERKNFLLRPPISNVDRLIIMSSICDPLPNTLVIDKMITLACNKRIEPIIVISKADLGNVEKIMSIYKLAGIKTIKLSVITGEGLEEIRKLIGNGITVFTGNSGVGKSSLLNRLYSSLNLETGDISYKLGRGRHTTRRVELFKLDNGYVADTPGFSSIDLYKNEVTKEDLPYCFNEFLPYINECKFKTCSHTGEKGCKILEALNNGKIHKSRYENYIRMYEELKNIKEWEKK